LVLSTEKIGLGLTPAHYIYRGILAPGPGSGLPSP